jgi:acetyl/propionyl-CoA carboxylase alpha subunit
MTTGLDLVREQIRIADGGRLDFGPSSLQQTGHAIECRIYAEVPEEHFRPDTGRIEIFEPPSGPGIRLDSGITRGSEISYHFDPMLAKLIAWAPERSAAIARMKRALDDFVLLGVRNNIEFLRRVISTDDFAAGRLDTGFLDGHPQTFAAQGSVPVEAILAASLTPSLQQRVDRSEPAHEDVWNSGNWRNS